MHIRPRGFYGIAGRIGCGKSGILSAILHDLPYYSGTILTGGSIAYVEQEPVILSGTVRENILFDRPWDEHQYQLAVDRASLHQDLAEFPKGDATMVGEKGITLSGGQKARVALARALYVTSDICLLDDPLSAVDSKVAQELFQRCILPLSREQTVLLVTHQTHFLAECQQIFLMRDGTIVSSGRPAEFVAEMEELGKQYLENGGNEQDLENVSVGEQTEAIL
jgi:ABC-type multidrug transport system fused ATPase/permease subunit